MTRIAIFRLLGQWFSAGDCLIYTVFPYAKNPVGFTTWNAFNLSYVILNTNTSSFSLNTNLYTGNTGREVPSDYSVFNVCKKLRKLVIFYKIWQHFTKNLADSWKILFRCNYFYHHFVPRPTCICTSTWKVTSSMLVGSQKCFQETLQANETYVLNWMNLP